MKQELIDAIADMQEEEAMRLAVEMLDSGENPQDVLDACREAMTIVGDRYEAKDYFLPELIIAGDMLQDIGAVVKPRLLEAAKADEPLGSVVLGTVKGDIHDIGKDIVSFMLDVNNFKVHDIGVDAAPEVFINKIIEVKPDVVGLSGFLTLAFDQMKVTVQAIEEAGLRDSVKIMIGGAIMDDAVTSYIGADAFGPDAAAAVKLAKGWTGVN